MFGRRVSLARSALGLFLAAACALALPAPASAQGLFEALFGGFRRAVSAPPQASSFADPFDFRRGTEPRAAVDSGPAGAYCVRACDGAYFPIRHHAGASAAEMCKSFCPASKTKIFSGGKIDTAVAGDGARYADLDNAYLYRDRVVANCTCNGKDAFGLVRLDAKSDPTLRPGDMVATAEGLVAFTGNRNGKTATFTPVADYGSFTKSYRDKLSQLKIMPQNPGANGSPPVPFGGNSAAREDARRAQLSR